MQCFLFFSQVIPQKVTCKEKERMLLCLSNQSVSPLGQNLSIKPLGSALEQSDRVWTREFFLKAEGNLKLCLNQQLSSILFLSMSAPWCVGWEGEDGIRRDKQMENLTHLSTQMAQQESFQRARRIYFKFFFLCGNHLVCGKQLFFSFLKKESFFKNMNSEIFVNKMQG